MFLVLAAYGLINLWPRSFRLAVSERDKEIGLGISMNFGGLERVTSLIESPALKLLLASAVEIRTRRPEGQASNIKSLPCRSDLSHFAN